MIELQQQGFVNSWQDAGRVGFAKWGVPPKGPMDPQSAELAALLVQAPTGTPVMESHFPGPVLKFHETTVISITGADFDAQLSSGRRLSPGGRYLIPAQEILSFKKKIGGEWVYIGFSGLSGLNTWWGSVDQPLQKGDSFATSAFQLTEKYLGRWSRQIADVIRFVPRPAHGTLTEGMRATVLPESNRMGIRIAGNWPLIPGDGFSSAVVQGTIQQLPSGQGIVLMADHQTTGGYPVLGEIIFVDLGRMAQKPIGDSFHLLPIPVEESWVIRKKYDQLLRKLSISLAV